MRNKQKRIVLVGVLVCSLISSVIVGGVMTRDSDAKTNSASVSETGGITKTAGKLSNTNTKKVKAGENSAPAKKDGVATGKTSNKASKAAGQTNTGKQNTTAKPNSKSDKSKAETKTSTPSHTHRWTPVYSTRQVAHTKQVPWTKCYCCGADMTGNPGHIDIHLANHESNVHYGTEYRTETYFTTENFISGYRCSCGVAK